jgi:sulfate adenylyltransferase
MSNLIPPHGGKGLTVCLLEGAELEAEKKKAAGLKKVAISQRVKGDLIMIGIGGFSPLTGFMTKADWKGVCESFLTADGTFWPVPVCLDVSRKMRRPSTTVMKLPSTIPKATRSWPP